MIIGKLIPARAQITVEQPMKVTEMILPSGFTEDGEAIEDFDVDLDDDWGDDDFEEDVLVAEEPIAENGAGVAAEPVAENGAGVAEEPVAENGAGEIEMLEEPAPETAEEAAAEEAEAQEAGAEPS